MSRSKFNAIINTFHLIFIFSLFVTVVIDSFELCKSIFYPIWGHFLAQAHMARGKLNLAQPHTRSAYVSEQMRMQMFYLL